jgi:hypothetical protein
MALPEFIIDYYGFFLHAQEELLRHSEVELAKRIDEIDTLKRECNLTHKSILTQHRATPNPDAVYRELASLREQVSAF